jgi:predicted nucleotidyltransferase
MSERIPATLLAALADVMKWLDASQIPSMVIGGVAVSMLGRARLTQDVDALVLLPESEWAKAISTAAAYGIVPRIDDPLPFARRSRMLLLTHTASAIDIDISVGSLSFEHQAIERAQVHHISGVRLRLPSVEDLLIMKAFAHRPKDMQDVKALLDAHPEADLTMVRQWVREFAAAVSTPHVLDDFEKIVACRRTR